MLRLKFPVSGTAIPIDHGYPLYAAISRLCPELHETKHVGIYAIKGTPILNSSLALPINATLSIQLPDYLAYVLKRLSNQILYVRGAKIHLGQPAPYPFIPSSTLYSRIVVIRGCTEPHEFIKSAQKDIDELGIDAKIRFASYTLQKNRKIIRVKNYHILGFSCVVENLNESDSIKLQMEGVGGKRCMGCGLFVPSDF